MRSKTLTPAERAELLARLDKELREVRRAEQIRDAYLVARVDAVFNAMEAIEQPDAEELAPEPSPQQDRAALIAAADRELDELRKAAYLRNSIFVARADAVWNAEFDSEPPPKKPT